MFELKGSYTIEAALLIPIIFFSMAIALRMGILLYEEIELDEQNLYVMREYRAVEDFYRYQRIKEVIKDD